MSENDFEERLNRIKKLSDKLSKLNKSETDDINPEKEEINLPESEENASSKDEAEEEKAEEEQIDEIEVTEQEEEEQDQLDTEEELAKATEQEEEEQDQVEQEIPPKSTKKDNLPKEKNDNTFLYVIIMVLLSVIIILVFNNYNNNSNKSKNKDFTSVEYNNEKSEVEPFINKDAIKESTKPFDMDKLTGYDIYRFQGEGYTRKELEEIAFYKGYTLEELFRKNPSIQGVGRQTTVTSKKNENKINTTKSEPIYPIKNYITGDNPYSKYYGPGIYDFENTHSIFIQSAKEDRLFILSDRTEKILIRTTYIKANENYTIEYLKSDFYNISFISGQDWSDEFKLNNCINGGFTKNLSIGVSNYTFYLNYPNPLIINNSWIKENFSFDSSNISKFPFPCL